MKIGDISISLSNSKMGVIPSFSLPAIKTCNQTAPCVKWAKRETETKTAMCYAYKLSLLRRNVRESYEQNYIEYLSNPSDFWAHLSAAFTIYGWKYFRIHVSGDFFSYQYLFEWIEFIKGHKECQFLAFTKQFNFVNKYIDEKGELPENIHIVFSNWGTWKCHNPYHLPESYVDLKDGSAKGTYPIDVKECHGLCQNCLTCFNIKKGEAVLLKQH